MKLGFRSAAVAASLCLTLGLAACGGDDGGSDEDQVRDLAQQVLNNDSSVCDAATDKFLDRLGGDKDDCEKASKDGDKVDSDVKDVEVDGNEASVTIEGERDGTLKFVKDDGDWKVDAIEESQSAPDDTDTTETETTDSSSSSSGKGEVAARAAGDAFLSGVREADEAVICGLLDEDYAKQLTGAKKFGIAECVNDLKGETFSQIQGKLKGVTTDKVVLDSSQDTGAVTLSNGKSIAVRWDGTRYVITRLGG